MRCKSLKETVRIFTISSRKNQILRFLFLIKKNVFRKISNKLHNLLLGKNEKKGFSKY